jgi:hypothetical protein
MRSGKKSARSICDVERLSERELAGLSLALGARNVTGWSDAESALASEALPVTTRVVDEVRESIQRARDPLGDRLSSLRTPRERRPLGATYTPAGIVDFMTEWARRHRPERVIDPGTGSGRFLVAAGRAFPLARLVGAEIEPLAALLARAHLAAAGMARRAQVHTADYRELAFKKVQGATLFIGNPPYVRHHALAPAWKRWFVATARARGIAASGLAGLHAHFFLATAVHARPGDYGAFVTAAEWLDVNYGRAVRDLFLEHLGGLELHVLDPKALPFGDAQVTAAITCFEVGARPTSVRIRKVPSLDRLHAASAGRAISRQTLEQSSRWSQLTRSPRRQPAGYVELGELCDVHRGQVTGNNRIWIEGAHSKGLPDSVLVPCVTKARELFANAALSSSVSLRRVIDLPNSLDELPGSERAAVEAFLAVARGMGGDRGFIATHRKRWWCVALGAPAPILATYMARRTPAFVRNLIGARHINIAHGLYPRQPLSDVLLDSLASYLARETTLDLGRTYAGGLTKFEPGEMARIWVPEPSLLLELASP